MRDLKQYHDFKRQYLVEVVKKYRKPKKFLQNN